MKKLFLLLIAVVFIANIAFVSSLDVTILDEYFKLDESSGAIINSIGNDEGTNNGATPNVAGKVNTAYHFNNATDDYITFGTSSNFTFNYDGTFSAMAWIKPDQVTTVQSIFGKQDVGSPYNGWQLRITSSGKINFDYQGASGRYQVTTTDVVISPLSWNHVAFAYNNENVSIYINGTPVALTVDTNTLASSAANSAVPFNIGNRDNGGANSGFDGVIDEVGISKDNLNYSTILAIYNLGVLNVSYPFTSYIELNSPSNNAKYIKGGEVVFNATAISIGNLTNMSLYINGILNETKSISGARDTEIFSKTFSTIGEYNWSVLGCDNIGCFNSSTRSVNITNYIINSISINSSVLETSYQTYSINITPSSSSLLTAVSLSLNGTEYSATKSGTVWSKSLDIPSSAVGSQSPYFIITYDGTDYNSNTTSQTILPIQFGLCNATLTVPYLNITFNDEADSSSINASISSSTWNYYLGSGTQKKTLLFSNTTENSNYEFCLSPGNQTLYTSVDMNYYGSSYPVRNYQETLLTLTSTTTQKILYLLGQADGIYSTFITTTYLNTIISGVTITATREISGENITVAQGTTDSSGAVTFWLNPNYDHSIYAYKTGYGSTTISVRPTQSTYTLILQESNNYSYVSNIEGLLWGFFPSPGIINQSTSRNYGFNVSSTLDNIVGCKIELLNKDKTIILSSAEYLTSNASICSVSTSYIINSTYPQIKGRLLVDIGNGYQILEEDAYWTLLTIDTTGMTFSDWFTGLKNFDLNYFAGDSDEEKTQHREYTQILIFFLIVMIICAAMNYAGWDIQTSGGMIFLVGFMVIFASFSGFLTLTNISPFAIIDKYFVAIIYSMFMIGFATRSIN